MIEDAGNEDKPQRSEWVTSTILIVIWVLGLIFVSETQPEMPRSMLIAGTIFFIVLIPAMKELVRTIERLINKEVSSGPRSRDAGRNKKQAS